VSKWIIKWQVNERDINPYFGKSRMGFPAWHPKQKDATRFDSADEARLMTANRGWDDCRPVVIRLIPKVHS
jgi:hypothetical protein